LVGRAFAGSTSTPGESVVAKSSSGTTSGGVWGVGGVSEAVVPTGVLCGGLIVSVGVVSVAVAAAVGSVVAVGFGVLVFGVVIEVSVVLGGPNSSGLGGSTFAGFSTSAGGAGRDVASVPELPEPDFCGPDCWEVAPFVPDSPPEADGSSSARATPPAIAMTV
jgi:ABC-type multidrug transport system permease subunit